MVLSEEKHLWKRLSSYFLLKDDVKSHLDHKDISRRSMQHLWLVVLQLLTLSSSCGGALRHLRVEAGSEDISTGHSQSQRHFNGRRSLAWSDFLHPAAHSEWPLPWIDDDPALSMSRAVDILRENGIV